MRRGSRLTALLPIVTTLSALGGCAPKQPPGYEPVSTAATTKDANWPYWPVLMRIHPLTRITVDRETGTFVLEARAEFLDVDGVSCRALGQVLLELSDRNASDDSDAMSKIWTVDLREREANALYFDAVTRTYLFRLELSREELPDQPELRVTYQGVDGATMSHRRSVRPYVLDSPATPNARGKTESSATSTRVGDGDQADDAP